MEYPGGRQEEESDEWKGSSVGREDKDADRTGRSYECVFCKRGFTTAQALGGHMNIHRKDRAKNNNNNNRTSTTSTTSVHHRTKDDDDLYLKSSYLPVRSYPPTHHHYFPAAAPGQHVRDCRGHQEYTCGYGALQHGSTSSVPVDSGWNLSLQVGSSRVDDDHDGEDDDDGDEFEDRREGFVGEEEELDLELRLGHDRP